MTTQINQTNPELHQDEALRDERATSSDASQKFEGGLTREELRALVVEMIG